MLSISDLRENYKKGELREEDLSVNPMEVFEKWFAEALSAEIKEPNAMVLSTVSIERKPRSRVVLLKDFSSLGFTFYTNYLSSKGREIEHNNNVCLNFNWLDLERQIRIEGKVSRVSAEESDAYFLSRPEGSKIGSYISNQSQPIESRTELDNRLAEFHYTGNLERPKHWGGYIIKPNLFEFWQGRENRLHDRIQYVIKDHKWLFKRLQP